MEKPRNLPDLPVAECIEALEALVEDRSLLDRIPQELRERLLIAAGRVSRPDRASQRARVKAQRAARRAARRDADEAVLDNTGIRVQRALPVFATPEPRAALTAGPARPRLTEPAKCYVCKAEYVEVHAFYDQMCPACAEVNWRKRTQTADLRGRVALVTGGRVKIGYQAVIKLLRAGARVIVTTRFPRDAAARYAREADFAEWGDRVEIHGLDLRHTPSVELFARDLAASADRLDFILNNACQTVRRPAGFYAHLMEGERAALTGAASALVARYDDRVRSSAEMSQIPLLAEDRQGGHHIFPTGRLDADLQQVDLRGINSWRLPMAEVATIELLEVHLVNAVAPFVLNARLKPLMLRHRTFDKHIVNVSAVEGQFYRSFKTDKHPHTNMAKAALNMMTRTSASDYARDGIYMNSVDTGWVTDEDPVEIAERKRAEHRFHPPLDIVDGAARICDPIFSGLNTGDHIWGKFLKDYIPVKW